ncbi:MAG: zinc ribbon domain-containing protein [Akkermansiaceae bacterium]|nr:zinc ribbon domain-containing protein [Akkermansiaceae bacterium]MCF7730273.1 zinc ribbon domain-containing protein [Akkermansiaceae bacterium]
MPTYLYETLPEDPALAPERFEVKQSMKDAALTRHPESGVPVRRVLVGGFAPMGLGKGQKSPASPPRSHPGGCSCCRH